MTFVNSTILIVIGIFSGIAVSSGTFALITSIGIITRMATKSRTCCYLWQYESSIIYGVIIFNVIDLFYKNSYFAIPYSIYVIILSIFGIASGIFVGCLLMSIAETLKVLPILNIRAKISFGMPYYIIAITIGKVLGSIYSLMKI